MGGNKVRKILHEKLMEKLAQIIVDCDKAKIMETILIEE